MLSDRVQKRSVTFIPATPSTSSCFCSLMITSLRQKYPTSYSIFQYIIYTGTKKERGLLAWGQAATGAADKSVSPDYEEGYEIYEIQSWSARVNNLSFTKYIPFFPKYDIKHLRCTCCKKNNKYEP